MKKLIAILLCLCLVLSLGILPALAAEEDLSVPDVDALVPAAEETLPDEPADELSVEAPAPEEATPVTDGGGAANVFYYLVRTGADPGVELMYSELVAVGGHPDYHPTWDGMSYTWHTNADLSGAAVDPSSYTIQSESDTLTFYGYLDSVAVTVHMPRGSSIDAFGQQHINRGGKFDANSEFVCLPDGYWAAAWTDAAGNLFDTENTPITEDIDLYALAGNFRATYMHGDQLIGGEGFLSPGTPRHVPASCLKTTFDNGIQQTRYDIIAWKDATGNTVDLSAATITADATYYAVLDGYDEQTAGPDIDWGFDWSVDDATGVLTVGGAETLAPFPGETALPWSALLDRITKVVVTEGVTEIRDGFFAGLDNVEEIDLPFSIEQLGSDVLRSSAALKTIAVTESDDVEFQGWYDEEGCLLTNEDILSGKEYTGRLVSSWLRRWVEGRFTDVSATAWYHDAVKFCYQEWLMNGMSDTVFSPNGSATRAQVVTVLWRIAGEPVMEDDSWSSAFSDVSAGTYYSDAVAWAAAYEITTGYPDGTFRPNNAVTRQDFLTFLYRFTEAWAGEQPSSCDLDPLADFADRDKVGSWAQSAECWSVAAGFQQGSSENGALYLNPTQSIKRSEMAAFLMRYCSAIWYGDSGSTGE